MMDKIQAILNEHFDGELKTEIPLESHIACDIVDSKSGSLILSISYVTDYTKYQIMDLIANALNFRNYREYFESRPAKMLIITRNKNIDRMERNSRLQEEAKALLPLIGPH